MASFFSENSFFKKYLATRSENQPNNNGNGEMTLSFFKNTFGFTGREALALMGIHTIRGHS